MTNVDRFTWERAVRATKMDPSTKLAALICGTYANQDGTKVRPGLRRLSEDAGLSQRSMKRAVVALRSMGLLDRVTKGSNLGVKDMVDVYRLVIPAGNQVPPMALGQVTPATPGAISDTNQVTPATEPGDTHVPLPSHDHVNYHSLSRPQRAVAEVLGLKDDDEKLQSVDKMLENNGAKNPTAWIRSCAKNGDLEQLLDDAHAGTWAKQYKAAEADRRRCPHGVINGKSAGQCVKCTEDVFAMPA
jgi:hypothetical protein